MVKQGYKQTEIGVIPEDWEVINLEKNFTLKARIGWQGLTTAEYLESGDYCLITGTDFKNGYIDWDNCVYVEKERYDQDRNIQIKQNDVLITKDGTIGKIAFIDKINNPTTLNSGVFVARPKNNTIHNRFFYYVLMSFYFDDFLSKITAGSTITHLYQKDFIHFNFILPPLPEQEAIATALSDADAWIESLEQLIAKKRLIKQGAMQELLTPKEDWEVKKLGEVCDVLNNLRIPIKESEREKGDNPYYGANGIQGYVKGYTHDGENVLLAEDGASDLKNYPVNYTIGKIWVNNHAHVLRGKENIIISRFLSYLLKSVDFTSVLVGGTRAKLNKSILENIEIPFPSLSEQTRIATILSDMDAEIEALEQKLSKARQIKQGMMQELLTGRVRLV